MSSPQSRYRARRCDAVDRDGNRCELAFGHERGNRGGVRHLVRIDDQPRVWATRTIASTGPSLRNYR